MDSQQSLTSGTVNVSAAESFVTTKTPQVLPLKPSSRRSSQEKESRQKEVINPVLTDSGSSLEKFPVDDVATPFKQAISSAHDCTMQMATLWEDKYIPGKNLQRRGLDDRTHQESSSAKYMGKEEAV